MKNLDAPEIWYIIGSQHLYGEQTLRQVAAHSRKIVEEFNDSQRLPLKLVFKPHTFQAGLETLAMALPGRTAGSGFSANNSLSTVSAMNCIRMERPPRRRSERPKSKGEFR